MTAAFRGPRPGRLLSGGVPLLLILLFVFLSVAGPSIWGEAASASNVAEANQSISAAHWMGTDDLGRDILARTLVATRNSLVLAVVATIVGGCVGIGLGLLSAMSRRLGRVLGALINVLIAFPALLLAIFFAVLFGIGSVGSVLAVGASFAPGFARITQTLTASVVSKEYVEASRVLGRGPIYRTFRHILPNIAEPVVLYSTIHIGTAVLALSGLSFLGLGVQPPVYDWGRLLNDGLTRIYVTPGVAIAPSIAIVLAGLTFNLAGERLSDLIAGRRSAPPARRPQPRPAEPAPGPAGDGGGALVDVRHLRVTYASADGRVTTPVRDVSFTLAPKERVGIVGESGSGKSLTAAAIAQLIEEPGHVEAERLRFMDADLLTPDDSTRHVLGRNMAMVFQDPGEALNPAIKIGTHLVEPAVIHLRESKPDAKRKALDALRAVAITDPARRFEQHRHELSGGMKQRVGIAIGLMGEARLLIADEPTTALDVTVQRQILRLVDRLGARTEAGLLFISHDIAVVSELCDRIIVMYAGFIVEEAATADLLESPAHPYTSVLLAASPRMGLDKSRPLVAIDGRMPGPDADLPGCYFAARCPRADATCLSDRPPLRELADGRRAACWHPLTEPGDVPTSEGATI
ncbi:dipeptide/oligopeptide/nickel ABC transporter permease/ATP-binding protein [Nonomuraea fuscirosea]|uniref:dipeptide/oligopeptide/nickel ABC transporter permease/ATP-binding protein n=3 Tax=Nonomuraea fuscirosea TaxID=1291556 RepID=UPI002DD7A3C8|nr:dipeptide/oligopeptide/nickel ABC transporter permease/ATP-binding protein [Nonomuraea fuscirosea]WSA48619.1 dipeptide/oligopeptide/nickel ABC transporter permease/ATP-binding protein [Nonomuraea fuscirosea]